MASSMLVAVALYATGAAAITIKSDACQCLNWKDTYYSGLTWCGRGFEFTGIVDFPLTTAEEYLFQIQNKTFFQFLWLSGNNGGRAMCDNTYMLLNDTKCARTTTLSSATSDEWYGKSWCYVSQNCASAMPVTASNVSVKFCEQGKDSLLSDMDPPTLMSYGKRMDFIEPAILVGISYPSDGSLFYNSSSQQQMAAIKASKRTTIIDAFDAPKQLSDKMIVSGDTVFKMPISRSRGSDTFSSFDDFECVENCEEV